MVEGDDGKLSYRRIAQILFLYLIAFIVIKGGINNKYGFYGLIALCVTFVILAGVITAQQLIALTQQANALKSSVSGILNTDKKEDPKEGTTPNVSDQP